MSDLADLFPGFASHWIDTSAGKMFARTGGKGQPLLALHGYPETHVMWHRVAPALAEHFTVVLADLPGYGWSAVPEADKEHAPYTKRAMAAAMIDIMEALGHVRFNLAGHDRGGRVSYRLALDHPGRVEKLAVLDIIPTWNMWNAMDARLAMRAWHWPFLAQPYPLPELLLRNAANEYFDLLTAAWKRGKGTAFDDRAIAHYRASFTDPLRIHAGCEDYRAGQSTDFQHDEADRKAGKKITCPMLAIWGATGLPSQNAPLEVWREWAIDVRGFPIESGHFLCEENPEATAKALLDFFLNRAG
jgi:haloacetate dehalogenase